MTKNYPLGEGTAEDARAKASAREQRMRTAQSNLANVDGAVGPTWD
ncbi:hypothetical protein [Mycobacterium sp. IEC1808]|nr:hypothetical protein [Mycobacterium sp. IEC1808]